MVYVMSDIHGNAEKFNNLLEQISLTEEDTLYILGDIVDRGPDPIGILRRVMKMKNVKMLLGNHEHMMMRAYFIPVNSGDKEFDKKEKERFYAHWYRNGCEVTIAGLDKLNGKEKNEIFEFVDSLPLNFEIEVGGRRFLLVHGYPAELFGKKESRFADIKTFAVWDRVKKDDVFFEDKTVIFGHTSTDNYQEVTPPSIWYGNNMIGIDCGGGYGGDGRISCLRLDDMKEFYA